MAVKEKREEDSEPPSMLLSPSCTAECVRSVIFLLNLRILSRPLHMDIQHFGGYCGYCGYGCRGHWIRIGLDWICWTGYPSTPRPRPLSSCISEKWTSMQDHRVPLLRDGGRQHDPTIAISDIRSLRGWIGRRR